MARNTRFFGGVFGGAAAGAVVVPELVVGALNCIGFTALGPAAGSIAAGIQSSIGCVAAGSPFAIAQSIAMGGMAGPLVATGAVVGVTAVLVSTALRSKKTNDNEPNPDSDEDGDGPDGEEYGCPPGPGQLLTGRSVQRQADHPF